MINIYGCMNTFLGRVLKPMYLLVWQWTFYNFAAKTDSDYIRTYTNGCRRHVTWSVLAAGRLVFTFYTDWMYAIRMHKNHGLTFPTSLWIIIYNHLNVNIYSTTEGKLLKVCKLAPLRSFGFQTFLLHTTGQLEETIDSQLNFRLIFSLVEN